MDCASLWPITRHNSDIIISMKNCSRSCFIWIAYKMRNQLRIARYVHILYILCISKSRFIQRKSIKDCTLCSYFLYRSHDFFLSRINCTKLYVHMFDIQLKLKVDVHLSEAWTLLWYILVCLASYLYIMFKSCSKITKIYQ